MTEQTTIGFIGLGIMGKPAAKNLVDDGYDLIVNDIDDEAVQDLEEYGATSVETAAAVAAESDVVITFLPEGKHVRQVALGEEGIIEGAEDGLVYIDMSTIGPTTIREVAAELESVGVTTIDAPVSGSEKGAKEAWMRIMIGGDEDTVEEYRDLFEVMGGQVTWIGDTGAGQVAKVGNNMIVASSLVGLSEALVLAEKAEVSQERLVEAISGGAAQSWALDSRAEGMINGEYEPGFFGKYHYKDLRIAVQDGEEFGAPMPLTAINHELFKSLVEKERGDLDTSAILTVLEDMAGLD
jgi:3-hydroxyisobutyrate dehydrogenase-like beta-hydroxyacid dehydrogenase